MTRQTSQPFRCHPLAQLAGQLLFSPPDRRTEQIRRAEALHDEIDPDTNYPCDYINYKITGYRSESIPPMLLTGQAILPDLRLIIDRLSHSTPTIVSEQDEPVESPQQLATRLGVSTKTIARWRPLGLRWRWVIQPNHQRRSLAFTASAVEHFLARHRHRVARAGQRSHIDAQTRRHIIERARHFAHTTGATLNRTAEHLAKKVDRAHQSVRLILEQHDRQHPNHMIFADRTGPLDAQQKHMIWRAYRSGTPVDELARQMGRTRSTIYRAIRQRRAAMLRRVPIAYTRSPLFDRPDADRSLTAATAPSDTGHGHSNPAGAVLLGDLPEPLQPLFDQHPAPADVQQSLLLRMNYLKHQAVQKRDHLDRYDPRAADLEQIETHIKQAAAIRCRLVTDHLLLVLSVARRHLIAQADQPTDSLTELLEIGIPQMIEAIDQYNVSRPQALSSYLTWSLMRRFLSHTSPHRPNTPKAHRKANPDTALKRLCDAAASRGVRLTPPRV